MKQDGAPEADVRLALLWLEQTKMSKAKEQAKKYKMSKAKEQTKKSKLSKAKEQTNKCNQNHFQGVPSRQQTDSSPAIIDVGALLYHPYIEV